MTFVRVGQSDVPSITNFLSSQSEYVMFPLNNLQRFGLNGDDPYAPRMWRNARDPLSDVLSITKAAMVMPYLPSGNHRAAARALRGRSLTGFVGPADHVDGLRAFLDLTDAAMEMDSDETHFNLDLDALIIPEGTTQIVPMSEKLRPVLTDWMHDYHIQTLGMSPDAAVKTVPERISREIAENRRVILMDGDTPVAATAFNAALPHIVQIGAVYTPPALRGRGHARRAVALHLDQARGQGVRQATLFASNPGAIAAYLAVGFRRIGAWRLALFQTPQVVP